MLEKGPQALCALELVNRVVFHLLKQLCPSGSAADLRDIQLLLKYYCTYIYL